MPAESFEIGVVGGGLVGSALAYGLAKRGRRVVVLDEGDLAHRASRGNFGLVWVQGKGDGAPAYAAWTRRSVELWPDFARELRATSGIDVAYARTGGFSFCLDEAELAARAAMLRRMVDQGGPGASDAELVDVAALRRQFPTLGRAVVGATFCPHDGHVNPLLLLRALRYAGARQGVVFRAEARIERIEAGAGFRLLGRALAVEAERVVLAAGLGSAPLAPLVGLRAPLRPNRGQILVTERLPAFLSFACTQIRQTAEGTVMLGDTKEDVGFDDGTTNRAAAQLAARAVRVFPGLARVRVVRQWAALRVMTPDGLPIYERSQHHPDAFLAACHSGVTLAAVHAEDLVAAVLAPQLTALAPFSADRFAVEAA